MKKITEFPTTYKLYIKKSIPIKAVQLTEKSKVRTLEGTMTGKKGDWLIQGVENELYVCKKFIFDKTYDEYTEKVVNHNSKILYINHKDFLNWYFGDNAINYHPAIEILKTKGIVTLEGLLNHVAYLPLSIVHNKEVIPQHHIKDGSEADGKIIYQPSNNYKLVIVREKT